MKTNINFIHLSVLILRHIHMDYAKQFLYRIHLSSLIELIVNKDILFRIIDENHKQARDNFSKVGTIITSKPSYESIDVIQKFFPIAHYVKHYEESKEENDQSI